MSRVEWIGFRLTGALVLAGLGLLLATCGSASPSAPASTVVTPAPARGLITQSDALAAALRIAQSPQAELSASDVTPRTLSAQLMTLAQAEPLVRGHAVGTPAGYAPTLPVWLVLVEGAWTDESPREFPPPTGAPTPVPYRRLAVILDAATGLQIEGSARP